MPRWTWPGSRGWLATPPWRQEASGQPLARLMIGARKTRACQERLFSYVHVRRAMLQLLSRLCASWSSWFRRERAMKIIGRQESVREWLCSFVRKRTWVYQLNTCLPGRQLINPFSPPPRDPGQEPEISLYVWH